MLLVPSTATSLVGVPDPWVLPFPRFHHTGPTCLEPTRRRGACARKSDR